MGLRIFLHKHRIEFILFILSFLIRAYSAQHGSPYSYHDDEHWFFHPAFEMTTNHSWSINWFRVPPLLTLLYASTLKFLNLFTPMDLVIPQAPWISDVDILPQQFLFLYIGRLIVAVFGSLSVVMIYRILKLYVKNWISVFFALIFAIMARNIFYSSYLRPEPLVTFFLLLSTYFLCLYANTKKNSWIVLAGASLGFACASKYNASPFLICAFIFLIIHLEKIKPILAMCGLYLLSTVSVFFVAIPYLFFRFRFVLGEITENYHYYMTAKIKETTAMDNLMVYMKTLYVGENLSILFWFFCFSIPFLPWIWKKLPNNIQPLTALSFFFIFFYTIFLIQFDYVVERNIVFIHPFILISMAIVFSILYERRSHLIKMMSQILAVAMFSIVLFFSIVYLQKIKKPLPQDNVRAWIQQNTPNGSLIFSEIESPLIIPTKYKVGIISFAGLIPPKTMVELNPKYIILTRNNYVLGKNFGDKYPGQFNEWVWSKKPEFEDQNLKLIPLGQEMRVFDFQKYKKEYIDRFSKYMNLSSLDF